MSLYSTKQLTEDTLGEIKEALYQLQYGSVEIFVQDGLVTQITKRIIKKTIPDKSKKGLDNSIRNR
ncbi:MAG: hypothetical protein UW86_C0031G0004 [Microgenomates group bacterium GW2011_GWA1_Microgenomates_45_10]|nr:MAG: hypothetical protein UW86_C0031G0004 [Microgenomates group bacterium GW2011_GWA1_Microgenomates_45_10]